MTKAPRRMRRRRVWRGVNGVGECGPRRGPTRVRSADGCQRRLTLFEAHAALCVLTSFHASLRHARHEVLSTSKPAGLVQLSELPFTGHPYQMPNDMLTETAFRLTPTFSRGGTLGI